MNRDQPLQTFIIESRELLAAMDTALLTVEHAKNQTDMVKTIFRTAHIIKGSASLFGLDHIAAFSQLIENVLELVREDKIGIADRMVTLLSSCSNYIGTMVDAAEAGQLEPDQAMSQRGLLLSEQLQLYLGASISTSTPALTTAQPRPSGAIRKPSGNADKESGYWQISLRFGPDVLRNGMEPLSFIRYLAKLGTIAGIVTLIDAVPDSEKMNPESCYLGFEITLSSAADQATIENVFEFLRDDCSIQLLTPQSHVSDYIQLIQRMPEQAERLGTILIRCGIITRQELTGALHVTHELL
ncbi:Hpt domain-containing protein [Solimicrobium silvestre]|uniref:Hpt domain n=1 Tax=Solimicrobium silvestre TaxID=2099400 RepID=A0A2S9GTU4_9BURK|nr:Hpt domain-containing protein [Solimicrobium silvestre]PRC91129.1 Hpt domain [Solimicrobium silvestre]